MTTKNKLLLHVDHLFNQNLSEQELNKKLESLVIMADWSRKQNEISDSDFKEIENKIQNKKNVVAGIKKEPIVEQAKMEKQLKPNRKKLFIIIILILFLGLSSVVLYNTLLQKKKVSLINPSDIKKEGRALRFQGKLVDSTGNPIDRKVDVTFNLYTQKNDGKPVYTGECAGEYGLVPGIDGSFTVSIGSDCNMKRIPDGLFSKSQGLYLGIQVGSDKELVPRYAIATVQYASNTDKVKGLTLGTNESSIPYIDEEGRLVIGAVSPKLKSTQGVFSIEGETVSIKTNEDSSGSINLSPAEGGNVVVNTGKVGIGTSEPGSELDVAGSIGLTNDLLLNGENTAVYQNHGGSIRFYTAKDVDDLTSPALLLASENKIGLSTNKLVDTISAGGSMSPSENGKFNLGSVTNKWKTIYTNELVMGEEGIAAFWQRKGGKVLPVKTTDDLVLGSQSDQSSLIKFSGKPNSPSWINSGLLGLGTSTPHSLFTAIGSLDNNSLSSLTNLSRNDTSATNVLRLGLGTLPSGTSARFVDFYAGATSDTNGTKVGSIRLQNGSVVYQTNGADFAEYFDLDEKAEEGDIIGIKESTKGKALPESSLIGVVSNVAGFLGNAKEGSRYKNKTTVGLIGQIRTHVSSINGAIKKGDKIAATTIPGYGGVAIKSGEVIGVVLDDQNEIEKEMSSDTCPTEYQSKDIECGLVTILVSPKYAHIQAEEQKDNLKGGSIIPAGSSSLTIFNSQIHESSIILLTSISQTPVKISLVDQKACDSNINISCRSSFTVISDKPMSESLKFNWLIVN